MSVGTTGTAQGCDKTNMTELCPMKRLDFQTSLFIDLPRYTLLNLVQRFNYGTVEHRRTSLQARQPAGGASRLLCWQFYLVFQIRTTVRLAEHS